MSQHYTRAIVWVYNDRARGNMSVKTDKAAAKEFLQWWFGSVPENFIGISYQKDLDNSALDDNPQLEDSDDDLEEVSAAKGKKGKREVQQFTYSKPVKVVLSQWEESSRDSHVYFCTTPLVKNNRQLQAHNAAGVPGLWIDIDAMRDLDIDGDEFYAEIRDQEPASCWTRSSQQGIQGFFMLDEFFSLQSSGSADSSDDDDDDDDDAPKKKKPKNKKFKDELKPLLLNIAYYFGGDLKVVSPARLMRLPGSVNPKRENYLCRAQYFDNVFTVAELRKRFKLDEHLVPKAVFYAIAKAMEKVYGPGSHHEPSVHLFGTCRALGLDEGSCERLAADLFKFFKDMADDPAPSVASTYNLDIESDGMKTLRNDFEEIADDVERAVKFWIIQKVSYCKKHGIKWKPEAGADNPLLAGDLDGAFQVKPDGTYFLNKDSELEMFANFTVRILYKVIKIDGKEVDVAELIFKNRKYVFEWVAEKDTSFTKFKTISALPPKLTVLKEDLWKPFMQWLGDQLIEKYLEEVPYYGLLDIEEGKPTLLLPKRDHPEYVWAESSHDTANHKYAFKDITNRKAKNYLIGLAQHYPLAHESKFIWGALGWFAATPFASFARAIYRGFPVLLVSGLGGSGKTTLIKDVLSAHMGCEDAQDFSETTAFARRKQLASNNLLPTVVDEFRDDNEDKTKALQGMIRILWDAGLRKAGSVDGSVIVDHLVGTMAIIGEHQYQDEATLHRTFSIRVEDTFMTDLKKSSAERKAAVLETQSWLTNIDHNGLLGSIIVQWMEANLEEIPEMMEKALKMVDKNLEVRSDRNRKGMSLVIFGLLVMARIYKHYDLEFPLDKQTMIDSIREADADTNSNTTYGAANLRTLFSVTDIAIMDELRNGKSFEHSVYEFDKDEENIIYFDINRWHDTIAKRVRGSSSATLVNRVAFRDLLMVSTKNEDSPILEVDTAHPIFAKNCITIDLNRVREQFGINVQQWKHMVKDHD